MLIYPCGGMKPRKVSQRWSPYWPTDEHRMLRRNSTTESAPRIARVMRQAVRRVLRR